MAACKNSPIENIDIEMPLLTYINSGILPSKSNQDRVVVGYSNAGLFDYMIVLDGHGGKEKELFVNHLMQLNWEQILTFHNNPNDVLAVINTHIMTRPESSLSEGSTISIVKIYNNKIDIYWMGDSNVVVKVNNNLYKTKPHDSTHHADMARYRNNDNFRFIRDHRLKVFHYPDTQEAITLEENFMINYKSMNTNKSTRINMTRALGHKDNDVLPFIQKMDSMTLYIEPTDNVTIIAASDGVWDMFSYDNTSLHVLLEDIKNSIMNNTFKIDEFLNTVKNKWEKLWKYYYPNPLTLTETQQRKKQYKISDENIQGDRDDISCCIYCKF